MCWTSLFNEKNFKKGIEHHNILIIHINAPGHEYDAEETKTDTTYTISQLCEQVQTVMEVKK